MEKKKAMVCTALLVIVIVAVLTASHFVKGEETGISLYGIIMSAMGYWYIGERIEKFYKWLME
jgi:hypothetical protein